MTTAPDTGLCPSHRHDLTQAVIELERQSIVTRLAELTGTPVDLAIKYLPNAVKQRIRGVIKDAMAKCLEVAIDSLDDDVDPEPPPAWIGSALTGITGGIGGFFGVVALPFELPLTTTLMLRSIAEIARAEGEDVRTIDTKLACLEVFALGGGRGDAGELRLEYYAVRTMLTKLTRDIGRYAAERGAINASSPIIARLVGEIVSRFGFAITDRFASGFVPVLGAVGGAAINMIFTDHFQRVARGHFVIRRLEREYGADIIRQCYAAAASTLNPGHRLRSAATI